MKLGIRIHTVRFIGLISVVCLALACAAFGQDSGAMKKRFTNEDVIGMAQLGLTDDVIIAKIRAMSAAGDAISFDTGVEGLKKLKAGGVQDSVIKAMINPGAAGPTVVAATGATPMTVDPNLPPPEVGVYWKDRANFVLLQGQALTNTKAGGKAGSLFTNGMRNPALGCHARRADVEELGERTPSDILFVCSRWIRCGGLCVDQAEQEERPQGISGWVLRRNHRREVWCEEGQGTRVQGGSRWNSNVQSDTRRRFEARRVCVFYGDRAGGDDVGGARGNRLGGNAAPGRIYDFSIVE